jgi:hypothetical protein
LGIEKRGAGMEHPNYTNQESGMGKSNTGHWICFLFTVIATKAFETNEVPTLWLHPTRSMRPDHGDIRYR